MSFLKNTFIGKYFSKGDITTIDSNILLESLGLGGSVENHYNDNQDFVNIQETNFIVNSVINKIAKKFSSAVFTDKTNSELLKKVNNPNLKQSKDEFWTEFAIFLLASGFTVIWKKYVSFGNFKSMELININPSTVTFNKDTIEFKFEDKKETIDISNVIIFYDTKRNQNTQKGYSRIKPLKSQIVNISLAQKAKNIQIKNSGTTIVSPKQTASGNNIDEGLNAPVPMLGGGLKSQKEEMEGKLNNRSMDNRIIVASKGLDAVNLSEKLNNVDFFKIVEYDALAIYDTYNFPIELSPYGKNATFENKGVAELSLLENEIFPLINNVTNSLNTEFSNKGNIDANYNHLGSMSIVKNRVIDTNQKIVNQYNLLLEKEMITKEEYKLILIENNILNGK